MVLESLESTLQYALWLQLDWKEPSLILSTSISSLQNSSQQHHQRENNQVVHTHIHVSTQLPTCLLTIHPPNYPPTHLTICQRIHLPI